MLQTMGNERGADHRGESQASAGWQGVDLNFNGRITPGSRHDAADYPLTSAGTETNPTRHKICREPQTSGSLKPALTSLPMF